MSSDAKVAFSTPGTLGYSSGEVESRLNFAGPQVTVTRASSADSVTSGCSSSRAIS